MGHTSEGKCAERSGNTNTRCSTQPYLGCLWVSCALSCLLKAILSLGLQTTETANVYNTFAVI